MGAVVSIETNRAQLRSNDYAIIETVAEYEKKIALAGAGPDTTEDEEISDAIYRECDVIAARLLDLPANSIHGLRAKVLWLMREENSHYSDGSEYLNNKVLASLYADIVKMG